MMTGQEKRQNLEIEIEGIQMIVSDIDNTN
jgi:hypothetical protein